MAEQVPEFKLLLKQRTFIQMFGIQQIDLL